MVSGTSKIKIIWLCHFVNEEIKHHFDTPNVKEMSPWINVLIEMFEKRNDIELHIVAPNIFTNKLKEFKIRNINYHFYKNIIDFIPAKIQRFIQIDSRTDYFYTKKRIKKIITNINPDLVHLHGAENPYYSAGILQLINKYPTLVSIQGFIRNGSSRDYLSRKRIKIEEEIIKKAKYIGVRTKEMIQILHELNPMAKLLYHNYPIRIPRIKKKDQNHSEFDIVFFSRVCKDKGIEDLLEAIKIVKKKKTDISLKVLGDSSRSYLKFLKKKLMQLGIEDNVEFLGFLKSQDDVHSLAVHAKIFVLPTYHDTIPSTILECMYMKLPVIAYAVGGINELNNKYQTIMIVKKNNIKELADKIIDLVIDENKRKLLSENAYSYVLERFINENAADEIIEAYREILLKSNSKIK